MVGGVRSRSATTRAKYVKFLPSDDLFKMSTDGTIDGWPGALNDIFAEFGTLKNAAGPKAYYLSQLYTSAG